jgi:hypothetical protein
MTTEKVAIERKAISVLPDTKSLFDALADELKSLTRYSQDVNSDRVVRLLLDTYRLSKATKAANERPGFEEE